MLGLAGGLLLSVVPSELAFGAMLTALLLRRFRDAGLAALVLLAASQAPLKCLDREVTLPRSITLRELAARERIAIDAALLDRRIELPRETLTRRELANVIAAQTRTELRVSYCATGATLLGGGVPIGGMRFRPVDGSTRSARTPASAFPATRTPPAPRS